MPVHYIHVKVHTTTVSITNGSSGQMEVQLSKDQHKFPQRFQVYYFLKFYFKNYQHLLTDYCFMAQKPSQLTVQG